MICRIFSRRFFAVCPTNRKALEALKKLPSYDPEHWHIQRHEGGDGAHIFASWETEEGPRAFADCLRTSMGASVEEGEE